MSASEDLVFIEHNIVKSKREPNFNIDSVSQMIFRKLDECKEREVLIDCEKEKVWSSSEVIDAITTLGIGLIDCGVEKGDVLAFFCPTSDVHAITLLASMCIGGVYAGNISSCPIKEIKDVVTESKAKYAVATLQNLPIVGQLMDMKMIEKLFVIDDNDGIFHDYHRNCISIPLLLKRTDQDAIKKQEFSKRLSNNKPDDLIHIVFTSGTTGKPKAISRTNYNVGSVLAMCEPGHEVITPADTVGIISSFSVLSGMSCLAGTLLKGAKVAIIPFGEIDRMLKSFETFSITVSLMFPSTLYAFNRYFLENQRATRIKKVLVSGEALSEDIAKEFITNFQPQFLSQCYCSSEMGVVTMKPLKEGVNNLKSNGVPVAGNKLKICDFETGVTLPPREIGEVCVNGPQVTKGYLNNEQANKECFDEEGFFRSGDAAYVDERGNLFFCTRMKEVIQYDAFQISPYGLEFILMQHAAVKEAAVIGVPDAQFGELPKAFVVLNPNFEHISKHELIDFVSSQVSDYKKLRGGLEFVEKFERTKTGKINRKALK